MKLKRLSDTEILNLPENEWRAHLALAFEAYEISDYRTIKHNAASTELMEYIDHITDLR